MLWVAWRQFRVQAAVALAALLLLAVLMLITGLHLRALYDASGVSACAAHSDCSALQSTFVTHDLLLGVLLRFTLLAAPALCGMFWAAPLVAGEFESGTYRLAWTQSITRTRWLAVKVALVGLASIAVGELLSLMLTWWYHPIDLVNMNRLTPGVFDLRGIVAIGYAAFGFALGLTAGTLIRRTLPAMATTLPVFVAARVVVANWVRPHLAAPLTLVRRVPVAPPALGAPGSAASAHPVPGTRISVHITSGPPHPGDWVLSSRLVKSAGRLHAIITYQPAGRYWRFQIDEMAIFLILGLLLIVVCFWWLRRGSPRPPRTHAARHRSVTRTIENHSHDDALETPQPSGAQVTQLRSASAARRRPLADSERP